MNVRNGIENLSQILPAQNGAVTTGASAAASTPLRGGSGLQSESAIANPSLDKAQLSVAATQAAHSAQSASIADIRLDKVSSIQSALQAGTYRVPASDVAQKVIASLLVPEK